MQFAKPIPFKEALAKLDSKTLITSGLTSSQWSDVPVALRERAFFSSQVESARFLQRGKDSITDFLEGNRETLENGQIALKTGSRSEFVAQLQAFAVAEGMGPLDPKDAGTIKDITSQRRLELIFDTQVRQAHDYGYWQQGQDQDVLDAYPAQRFIRVMEVKEPRDGHAQFEGEVRLKSDLGFWNTLNQDFGVPWGPWGWGCGHDVEDVDRAEAETLGLIQPGETVEGAEESFNEGLEASTEGLDGDLLQTILGAFGSQIRQVGDRLEWSQ